MMGHLRSASGNGEDNAGIPEYLRCKRTDGKQWRCTAMSMPGKTVCEKHYIQAKKRSANSVARANEKKAKRKLFGESDTYLESKDDEFDIPYVNTKVADYAASVFGKFDDMVPKSQDLHSTDIPPLRSLLMHNAPKLGGDDGQDIELFDENCRSSYTTGPVAAVESSRSKSHNRFDSGALALMHNIQDMAAQDKLQYLHCLLSSVLPVVKQVLYEQLSELELETSLQGCKSDIPRAILGAKRRMFCNFCLIPIIDYHRHCGNCSYILCLTCCQDLRRESMLGEEKELVDQIAETCQGETAVTEKMRSSKLKLTLFDRFPDWKVNKDICIPCPPKEYGGCGCPFLTLKRIFKTNWVAKLVTNVEEMVNSCKLSDLVCTQSTRLCPSKLCQSVHRGDNEDNFLYFPTSQDIKIEGVGCFHDHWVKGEPVVIKQACDSASASSWDPIVIWRGILEATGKNAKDEYKTVKAVDCLDWSEVDIELGQFIKGYSEGRIHENGWPEMLKLKDWPPPNALEFFYQRPEFYGNLPLLEHIHPKWGPLNVAARLPHYYIQNDLGPQIFISYGTYEELGRGDSVTNLHFGMLDKVFLLMHTAEVKLKGWQRKKIERIQRDFKESDVNRIPGDLKGSVDIQKKLSGLALDEHAQQNECAELNEDKEDIKDGREVEVASGGERKEVSSNQLIKAGGDIMKKVHGAAIWDVFRRQDVPKLVEYLKVHWKEFRKPDNLNSDSVTHPLHYQAVFLTKDHKRELEEEFKIEPWTFEQHVGDAVFIPAGCPYQVRNLQSSVQLGLDFLSPESLGESLRLADEIRCLPNDHAMKLQMLEVGKISLYTASSAIKEVQKLVLDPKVGAELGFEDPNLTAMVSANLEEIKQRQITCV